ncbi:MAG: hypothetical protein JJE30_14730 [Desulfuromonadales bacterium]|nr:hypothetical protein [Desulfuromonadales bacterium]
MAKKTTIPAPPLVPGMLLTDKDVAAALRISRGQVWALVKNLTLEPPFKLSSRTTRWKSETVIAAIERVAT